MEELFFQTDTCDAKLVSADHKEFKIHKAVAAIASEEFRLHFFHKYPGSTYYKTNCKSDALLQIVNFMYCGWRGMSPSSLKKFCRLHQGSNSDAIDDWVDTITETYREAKQLRMFPLCRSILIWFYEFLKLENSQVETIVKMTYEKSKNHGALADLEKLSYYFYWFFLKNNEKTCDANTAIGVEPESKIFEDKVALLLLGAPDDKINGLYRLFQCTNGKSNVSTYHQQNGNHTFEENFNSDKSNDQPDIGFLHYENEKGKNRTQVNVCKWNSESNYPIWTNDSYNGVTNNPAILRFKCL